MEQEGKVGKKLKFNGMNTKLDYVEKIERLIYKIFMEFNLFYWNF